MARRRAVEYNRVMQRLARLVFRLVGWHTEGAPPATPRYVLIAAPHTSNWDAAVMLLAARIFGIELSWFIKKSWFFFPMGALLRRVGGVPIDRSRAHGMVEQAVAELKRRDKLVLAVPPEGTRGRAAHWKSGFYHIARGAGVPIVLGYLDYGRKAAGLGPAFVPTGDIEADFAVFREFYSKITARYPDKVGPVAPPPSRPAAPPPPDGAARPNAGS